MTQLWEVFGGLGIFLLGIVIMTSGLKDVAGDTLRGVLKRFTHSPVTGACTGAVSTAILQSSSAITIAAVGFVGAGLLSFPQALGIIFGANIGTTATGWMVALLGFKLELGTAVLPVILLGILLHLFARGRLKHGGMAMAGFGLIFIGIATMQTGMSGLEGRISPDSFPNDGVIARLQLLLIGVGITLVTQSSSAGVAVALTAVHTATINFEQAAAMVIGMNVGTTATALVATLGGSVDARRTGYSHVVYNLMVGIGAFALLTPYVWLWEWWRPGLIAQQPEIPLVAFHTAFNTLGVLLILPFTRQYAAFIQRLVPEKFSSLERRLDKHLLTDPFIALEAAHSTLQEIFLAQLRFELGLLRHTPSANPERRLQLRAAIETTQHYLDQIHSSPERDREWQFLMACIHSLDHMRRLQGRLLETQRAQTWQSSTLLKPVGTALHHDLHKLEQLAAQNSWSEAAGTASARSAHINEQTDELREQLISQVAEGRQDSVQGDLQLESLRWLGRVADHLWRVCHHMQLADEASHRDSQPAPVSDSAA